MLTPAARAIGLMGVYLILLFPDGHLPSRRWRFVAWAAAVAISLGSSGEIFRSGVIDDTSVEGVPNPLGIEALDRLFDVARNGENSELRQQAIHWLGQKAGERSLAALRDMVNSSDADTDVQLQVVHAISQRPAGEAVPLLIQLARTHLNPEVRRMAIHRLSQSGDPRALEFIREVLTK